MKSNARRLIRQIPVAALVCAAAFAYFASRKGATPDGALEPLSAAGVADLDAIEETAFPPHPRGFLAPRIVAAPEDVFVRPDDAYTPALWEKCGASNDFQPVTDRHVAGICGVATTAPRGLTNPYDAPPGVDVYAPFFATNGFIRGTSDFWTVERDGWTVFVWKDIAFGRYGDELVSFAAEVSGEGDVAFVYGDEIPDGGFASFVTVGGETFDMADFAQGGKAAVLERDLSQTGDWWMANYPENCRVNDFGGIVTEFDTNIWTEIEVEIGRDGDGGESATESVVAGDGKAEMDGVSGAKSGGGITVQLSRNSGARLKERQGNVNKIVETLVEKRPGGERFTFKVRAGHLYEIEALGNEGVTAASKLNKIMGVKGLPSGRVFNWVDSAHTSCSFHIPPAITISGSLYADARFWKLKGVLDPPVSNEAGSWTWVATNGLALASAHGDKADIVRIGAGGGTVNCRWSGNGVTVEKKVSIGELPSVTNGVRYLEIFADPELHIVEGRHLDAERKVLEGNAEGPLSTTLRCAFNGGTPGTLTLDALQSDVPLTIHDKANAEEVSLPLSWTVTGMAESETREFSVAANKRDFVGNTIGFLLKFEPESAGAGLSRFAFTSAVEFDVQTDCTWTEFRRRHVFGPLEGVTFSVRGGGDAVGWYLNGLQIGTGANVHCTMPSAVGGYSLSFTAPHTNGFIQLCVIPPTREAAYKGVAMDAEQWAAVGKTPPPAVGEIGAGLYTTLRLEPMCVSFEKVKVMEGETPAVSKTGVFLDQCPDDAPKHDASEGAWREMPIGENNEAGFDSAAFFDFKPATATWNSGGYDWHIPVYWFVDDNSRHLFSTNDQSVRLSSDGTATVSKYGYTVTREKSGKTTVSH